MFIFGITVAIIGMGIVFCELVFLIVVIKLITLASKSITSRKNGIAVKPAEISSKEIAPAGIEAQDDGEIAAVIAAAIACMTQSTTVIKAIKRIQNVNGSTWSQAGRQETMSVRQ